jgi:hypothetical protein
MRFWCGNKSVNQSYFLNEVDENLVTFSDPQIKKYTNVPSVDDKF